MAYTTIDDPSQYFQTKIYTGNGSSQSLTFDGNSDMQPDWLWTKSRGDNSDPIMRDSSRGIANRLLVHATDAEGGATGTTSFDSDGFSLDSTGTVNANTQTFVAWGWKANGGTTTTNDASATSVGTIDSVYQANTTAGFSIVTHTGTGSAGTIAHGLGAVPKWMLIKRRTGTAENWCNYHASNTSAPATDVFFLNTNDATADTDSVWNDTDPTSTVFSVKDGGAVNESGGTYVTYLFTPIQGYSKFGSYTGNGDADGPFVYTGFKPAWVMIKNTSASANWHIYDNKRDAINVVETALKANSNGAEFTTSNKLDFVSNGFKNRAGDQVSTNTSGSTYVYFAFAEHPFVSSEGAPVTAR